MQPDYIHWLEALFAALIGLGGWLWSVGRKYQSQKDAIEGLSERHARLAADLARHEGRLDRAIDDLSGKIAEVEKARGESAAKIYARLNEISRDQAAQGAQITHIMETCNRTQHALMAILSGRRVGGGRPYDPPEEA